MPRRFAALLLLAAVAGREPGRGRRARLRGRAGATSASSTAPRCAAPGIAGSSFYFRARRADRRRRSSRRAGRRRAMSRSMRDTIYHWASITKTMTGIAIMQLRDRGLLSLDDPIIRYVPELARVHNPFGDTDAITHPAADEPQRRLSRRHLAVARRRNGSRSSRRAGRSWRRCCPIRGSSSAPARASAIPIPASSIWAR